MVRPSQKWLLDSQPEWVGVVYVRSVGGVWYVRHHADMTKITGLDGWDLGSTSAGSGIH